MHPNQFPEQRILQCRPDPKQRTLYLMSSACELRQINISNGSVIFKTDLHIPNFQVVDFALAYTEMYEFIIVADKKSFIVYQNNEPLRQASGAHQDIVLIRVDTHFGLIATATMNGEIGLWDLALSRLLC
jgi:hypothetical protein